MNKTSTANGGYLSIIFAIVVWAGTALSHELTFSRGQINFGEVNRNTSHQRTVKIYNNTGWPLTDCTATGNISPFPVSARCATIAARRSCPITVSYRPKNRGEHISFLRVRCRGTGAAYLFMVGNAY